MEYFVWRNYYNPFHRAFLDSRFRGNDLKYATIFVIPAKAGIQEGPVEWIVVISPNKILRYFDIEFLVTQALRLV